MMKKFFLFIVKCSFVFILSYILCTLLLLIPLLNRDPEHQYLASDLDKLKRLSEISSPRMVFIGGSNLAFGLHSGLIKDSLKMEPVNMGIHAGIGLEYMLAEVMPYLGTKDVLVIIPEYEQFSDNCYHVENTLSDLFLIKREWMRFATQTDWLTYPRDMINELISDFVHSEGNRIEEAYDRTKFNEYGDYTGHWMFDRHIIVSQPVSAFHSAIIDDIKWYIHEIRGKGTTVYLYPPCYRRENYLLDVLMIDAIQKELQTKEIPFNANPTRYVFEDFYFIILNIICQKRGESLEHNI